MSKWSFLTGDRTLKCGSVRQCTWADCPLRILSYVTCKAVPKQLFYCRKQKAESSKGHAQLHIYTYVHAICALRTNTKRKGTQQVGHQDYRTNPILTVGYFKWTKVKSLQKLRPPKDKHIHVSAPEAGPLWQKAGNWQHGFAVACWFVSLVPPQVLMGFAPLRTEAEYHGGVYMGHSLH